MSEFGRGYAYNLGLFLAHAGRERGVFWFDGATDHLQELEIPSSLPEEKKREIEGFREKCFAFRVAAGHRYSKRGFLEAEKDENRDWAIAEAKRFLLEWDQWNQIPSEQGEWE